MLVVGSALLVAFAVYTLGTMGGGVAELLAAASTLGFVLLTLGTWRRRTNPRLRVALVGGGSVLVVAFLGYSALRSAADFVDDQRASSAFASVGALGMLLVVLAMTARRVRT